MDLIALLNQDNIRISNRPDNPERANYACPVCGGDDRFVIWKNEGRYNAGRYWCNQCRISGDIVSYLMDIRNFTYPETIEFLGGNPVTATGKSPIKQKDPIRHDYKWQKSATEFVRRCNKQLNNHPSLHEDLFNERGITLETANRFMLGWNLADQFADRKEWKIPPKLNEDGSEKKLLLPAGLVIPHYNQGFVSSVRIRRKYDADKYGKYHFVGATNHEPLHIRPNVHYPSSGVIMTEGELDAIRVAQEFNNVDIIGMASASIGIPRESMTYNRLFDYDVIALCFDNDDAGRTAAENIQRFLPNAYYVTVPKQYGKDITEAFQKGLDPEVLKKYINLRIDKLRNSKLPQTAKSIRLRTISHE